MSTNLIEQNETQELLFTDGKTVMLFPQGWAQAFPDAMAEDIFDEDGAEGSLYGYYSESGDDNNFTCNYQPVLPLQRDLDAGKVRPVTLQEAQTISPRLFEYMDRINRGEDVSDYES